jgi:hypothetical protein
MPRPGHMYIYLGYDRGIVSVVEIIEILTKRFRYVNRLSQGAN